MMGVRQFFHKSGNVFHLCRRFVQDFADPFTNAGIAGILRGIVALTPRTPVQK